MTDNYKEITEQDDYIEQAGRIVRDRSIEAGRDMTYHVTTFGCQMNARDSEKLTGILEACGYVYEEEESLADFVIYNTCTIRDNADQKLYGHLGSLVNIKKRRADMIIAVCGCLPQEKSAFEKIKNS